MPPWVTQQKGSTCTEDASLSSKRRWTRVHIVLAASLNHGRWKTFAQILPNRGRGTTSWWGSRTSTSGTATPTSARWGWSRGRRCPVCQPSWPRTSPPFHLDEGQLCPHEGQHCPHEGRPFPAATECQHPPWPCLLMLESHQQLFWE